MYTQYDSTRRRHAIIGGGFKLNFQFRIGSIIIGFRIGSDSDDEIYIPRWMDGWIGQVLLMVSNCTTTPDRAWLVPPMSIHPSGSFSSRYCCFCAGSDAGWLWIVMDRPVGRSLNNWKLADAQLALTLRCRCRPALLLLLLHLCIYSYYALLHACMLLDRILYHRPRTSYL